MQLTAAFMGAKMVLMRKYTPKLGEKRGFWLVQGLDVSFTAVSLIREEHITSVTA